MKRIERGGGNEGKGGKGGEGSRGKRRNRGEGVHRDEGGITTGT